MKCKNTRSSGKTLGVGALIPSIYPFLSRHTYVKWLTLLRWKWWRNKCGKWKVHYHKESESTVRSQPRVHYP